MRRAALAIGIVVLVAANLPAFAQIEAQMACTISGTQQDDARTGTDGPNVICLKEGDDYGTGLGGDDKVRGSSQSDTLVGGSGHDLVRGGKGPDRIFVVDGHPGDEARGGGGYDRCYGDKGDTMKCEESYGETLSYPLATVLALTGALNGSIMFTEETQTELVGVQSALDAALLTLTETEDALATVQDELKVLREEIRVWCLDTKVDPIPPFCPGPPK